MSNNIVWHSTTISKEQRQELKQQKSCVIWLTGLSGSGKSTIANEVDRILYNLGKHSYVLDGDNIRHGLNNNLGFSKADRDENIRRIAEVSKLFVDSGQIVVTAFISPFREERDKVRALFEENEFIEVFVDCPLAECEKRDPKGLYKKARVGEIPEFTGINSPYEEPLHSEITIASSEQTVNQAAQVIVNYLRDKQII